MSAEVVVKKRGRPKKADLQVSTKDKTSQSSKPRSTKSGTTARGFSTTESLSQKPAAKKSTKRKQTILLDDGQLAEEVSELKQTPKSTVTQPKLKSAILEQAKAFERQGFQSSNSNKATSLLDTEIAQEKMTPSRDVFSSSKPNTTEPTTQQHISLQMADNHNTPANATTSSFPSQFPVRSSFLSAFLSPSDPGPEIQVSEDARISDRSAFSSNAQPSIDAIVGGAGISSLSSFEEAAIRPKKSLPARDSAIPITPPSKTFKGLALTRFPSASEPPKSLRRIDPTTYAAGSFSAFKSTQPLASIASSSSSSATAAAAAAAAANRPGSTRRNHPAQQIQMQASAQTASTKSSSNTQPTKSSPPTTTATATAAEKIPSPSLSPSPSPSTQPSRPVLAASQSPSASPASSPSPLSSISASAPAPTPMTRPQAPPRFPGNSSAAGAATDPFKKRPTEMSPAELHANPEFRTLRRRWTGLIVGIPVLVTTTYVLWKRFEMDKKEVEHRAAWLGGSGAAAGRERGVVPVKKREEDFVLTDAGDGE